MPVTSPSIPPVPPPVRGGGPALVSSVLWVALGLLAYGLWRSAAPSPPSSSGITATTPVLTNTATVDPKEAMPPPSSSAGGGRDVGRWRLGWRPLRCGNFSWLGPSAALVRRCAEEAEQSLTSAGDQDQQRAYCRLRHDDVTATAAQGSGSGGGSAGLCAAWATGEWIDLDSTRPRRVTSDDLVVALADARQQQSPRNHSQIVLPDVWGFVSAGANASLTPLQALAALEHWTRPSTNTTITNNNQTSRRTGTFIGDSMVRQLHARIAAYLRGQGTVFEHTSLGEVEYEVGPDGDSFVIQPRPTVTRKGGGGRHRAVTTTVPRRPSPPRPDCLFRADFFWAATAADFHHLKRFLPLAASASDNGGGHHLQPAFQVHALMYWTGNDFSAEAAERAGREAAEIVTLTAEAATTTQYIAMTTPPRDPARTPDADAWNSFLRIRNEALRRAWAAKPTSPARAPFWLVELEAAATTMPPGHRRQHWLSAARKDDKHFMCTFDPKAPSAPATAREDTSGCRDRVNLATVAALLDQYLATSGF